MERIRARREELKEVMGGVEERKKACLAEALSKIAELQDLEGGGRLPLAGRFCLLLRS